MNSGRVTNVVVRSSEALAALLGGWAFAARALFSGSASPLHRNILVTLAVFMAALLVVLAAMLRRKLELRSPAVLLALLAFLAATALAACFAGDRFAATVRAVEVASWTVLGIALVHLVSTPFRARVLVAAAVATLAVLTADSFYHHFVSDYAIRAEFDRHVQRLLQSGQLEPSMVEAFHKRVFSGDVYGTFTTANQFAGFLVLLLPLAAAGAWVRWRERKSAWEVPLAALLALFAAGAACVLVLTKSKGGVLSLAVALGGWGAVAALSRIERKSAATLAGVLVACAVLLAPSAPIADNATEPAAIALHTSVFGDSAEVRIEYWKAGLDLWKTSPWLGVGPGNFADGYGAFRTPEGSETRRAHNDYLETAAETGVVGLAAFLAIWVAWWWAMCRRRRTFASEAEENTGSRVVFAGAVAAAGVGAVAFALMHFEPTVEVLWMLVVGVAAWLAVYFAQLGPARASENGNRLLRQAIGAGVAALLVHFAIDFDLTEPGITATLVGMLAAGLALREPGAPAKERAIPPWGQMLFVLSLAAALALGLATVVYPLVDAGQAMAEANDARDRGVELNAEAGKLAPEDPRAEAKRQEASLLLTKDYPRFLDEAIAACPYDPEPWMDIAKMEAAALRGSPEADRSKLDAAVARLKTLTPADPGPWWIAGRALWDLAKSADETGRRELADKLAAEALVELDGAVQRYPARPDFRLVRARVLDRLGRGPDALADYRSALDLAERTSQKELKFSPSDLRDIRLAMRRIESAPPRP